jgi:hypothetical protein
MDSEKHNNIYQAALKYGLIKPTGTKHLIDPNHHTIIPLTRVNQFFFGTSSFDVNLNRFFLSREIITHQYGIDHVKISKLDKYLEEVLSILRLEENMNCCPYNFYKTIGKNNVIPEHYQLMICAIDNFLKWIDTKETLMAKTIRNIIAPNTNKGQFNKIETSVVDILNLGNQKHVLLKFYKKGSPLFIFMEKASSENKNEQDNLLRMDTQHSDEELERLYEYVCTKLRMDNPEEFIINNIEKICGSREFAELMVKSYMLKDNFIFNIDTISSIILWKDSKKESSYQAYFISRYPELYQVIDAEYFLNFEGINKFLLNISESDVINFEVKEQINNMYFSSIHELIYSFELLYKNRY